MAIKMRINKKGSEVECEVCGENRENSVEMFDIQFYDGMRITVCDYCMNRLLDKALSAVVGVNHKTKSPHDMWVIRKRHAAGLW